MSERNNVKRQKIDDRLMNKNVKFKIKGVLHHGAFACWSTNYTETPHGIGQYPVAICISNGQAHVVPANDLIFVLPERG